MSLIKLSDIPWLLGIAVLGICAYLGSTVDQSFRMRWWICAILWTPAAFSVFLYGYLLLYKRWKAIYSITFVTKHGVRAICGSYFVTRIEMEAAIDDALANWQSKTGYGTAIDLAGWTIKVREFPFKSVIGLVAGLTNYQNKLMEIGYVSPIARSALTHEIGHVIFAKNLGVTDQESEHAYAKSKGLD